MQIVTTKCHRRALVVMNGYQLLELLGGGCRVIGFPDDVRLIAVHGRYEDETIALVLEHDSFAEVYAGDELPVLTIQIESLE